MRRRPPGGRARRRRRSCCSSGGPPAAGPRGSTRRWSRTPARTPECGVRSSSSAPSSGRSLRAPASTPSRGRASRHPSPSPSTGTAGGRSSSPRRRRRSPTSRCSSRGIGRSPRSGSSSTSCVPTATCRRTASSWRPALFVATDAQLENLAAFAESGGVLLVGFGTAITDEDLHVRLGGYLGEPLRRALGVWIEEFAPPAAPDLRAVGGMHTPLVGLEGEVLGRDAPRRRMGGVRARR